MNREIYKKAEIIRLRNKLKSDFYSLNKEVESVEKVIKYLNKIIVCNNDKTEEEEISIDESILLSNFNKKTKFSWQAYIIETLRDADEFLTCNMIFSQIKIENFFHINNKRNSIKNLSSALSILVENGKIGRFKHNDIYYYGDIEKHFNKIGQPLTGYLKKPGNMSN